MLLQPLSLAIWSLVLGYPNNVSCFELKKQDSKKTLRQSFRQADADSHDAKNPFQEQFYYPKHGILYNSVDEGLLRPPTAQEVVSCANEFKAISQFLFYQIQCNWIYVEIFDLLGHEFVQYDRSESICILLHAAIQLD
ncbi:hypothetical protein STEG23_001615 [Scotinomys teguina]